ncbi:MAG: trehalose/maltose transport system permease protein [Solirubrobacteraceae bacterium]|nr:trehalose/maltose transport system permease protein [Solirubrobacteraceae bacterium]
MTQRRPADYLKWTVGIAAVVFFALLPIVWIFSLSLKTPDTVSDKAFIPQKFTLDNYTTLFQGGFDSPLLRPLINSIAIALIATVIAVTLASFTAYAIARLDFPGKAAILAGALAIAMFPQISVVGPLFDMWRTLHLYDTYPGLIIPYLTFSLPLAIFILVAFFR